MEQSKFYQIKNITEREYILVGCDGSVITRPIQDVDNSASVFTIQDAKDGDVLVVNCEVFIYAHRKQMYSIAVAHCFVDSVGGFYFDGEFGYTEKGNSIHPATKEQRDTLMKAMADAGYTFDFEKKELKKIEQKLTDKIEPKFHEGDKLVSTKNPRLTYKVLEIGNINELGNPEYKVEIFTDGKAKNPRNIHYIECYKVEEWAKLIEQKSAWSEEDKARYYGFLETEQYMLDVVNGIKKFDVGNEQIREECTKELTWLKSLKERYTWKPSEEQIIELHRAISGCSYDIEPLIEIEEYLKKLREE